MATCKTRQQAGGGKTGKIQKTKTSNDGFFLANLYVYMVWAESIIPLAVGGNKEFSLLFVLFGLHDLLDPRNSLSFVSCVRTYNSQVLRARIREVLPEVRCKWDGRLGTVFTGFELIEYASVLTGQRIFTNKRKGCWFKTQKVWGKFQRKVVAELELLLRHKTEDM